jgi:LPXTG-motif cell wall-anchored protein
MHKMLGLSLLLIGMAANCMAVVPSTPEIDPSSATAAVALLAGGLLVIRYRRKK